MVRYKRVIPQTVVEEKTEEVAVNKLVLNYAIDHLEIKLKHHNNVTIPCSSLTDGEQEVFDLALKIAERVLGLNREDRKDGK